MISFCTLVFALLQFFFVVKPIQRVVKQDIAQESKPLWELRDMGLANRRFWYGILVNLFVVAFYFLNFWYYLSAESEVYVLSD